MGIFNRLRASITANPGGVPQTVVPLGWTFGLSGAVFVRNAQVYSASMTPDLALGNWITITATTGAAFTVNAPTINGAALSVSNTPIGLPVYISILNNSGGNLGAVTLNAIFKGNSGFTANQATGTSISAMGLFLSSTQILGVGPWTGPFAF
jgi:hypothetical protein